MKGAGCYARRVALVVFAAALFSFLCWAYRRSRDERPRLQRKPKTATHPKGPARSPAEKFSDTVNALGLGLDPAWLFPRHFEQHGHVVVVRLNAGVSAAQFTNVASCFVAAFSPIEVSVVLLDSDGIVGELRKPKLEVLWADPAGSAEHVAGVVRGVVKRWRETHSATAKSVGATADGRNDDDGACSCVATRKELDNLLMMYAGPDQVGYVTTDSAIACGTFTMHIENKVRYCFDVRRVMFSSGNTTERMHFAKTRAPGEVVVDMFAGIGYFTLPLAMNSGAAVVHALEKNPDSVDFLRISAAANRVDRIVRPQCGDNRQVGNELVGTCDRVLMGYIPSCVAFLPRAVEFLKKDSAGASHGIIHYHFLADKKAASQVVHADCVEELGEELADRVTIAELRCVKSYAPKQFHFVADLKF